MGYMDVRLFVRFEYQYLMKLHVMIIDNFEVYLEKFEGET